MKIVNASYKILTPISQGGIKELQQIELAARTCYKSENKIQETGESAKALISNLIKNGHEAMLEHSHLSVKFICDRGVSHEIVRHRLFSFAQESTRYCNYGKEKFGHDITFINPKCFHDDESFGLWASSCRYAENVYFQLIDAGYSPQMARGVLPTSLKTEIVVSGNYREWRHFFKLRTDKAAHPQIVELARPLCVDLAKQIPIIFDDIIENMNKGE